MSHIQHLKHITAGQTIDVKSCTLLQHNVTIIIKFKKKIQLCYLLFVSGKFDVIYCIDLYSVHKPAHWPSG